MSRRRPNRNLPQPDAKRNRMYLSSEARSSSGLAGDETVILLTLSLHHYCVLIHLLKVEGSATE